ARATESGDLILLEDQDRTLWNSAEIAEGMSLIQQAISAEHVGVYTIQAVIASLHSSAPSAAGTDWNQIVRFYDMLYQANRSPIVELNRAVAIAMRDGPAVGLDLIDAIQARGDLADYHLVHAAKADLCRRLGRTDDARAAYETALRLARQDPER